MKKIIIGLLFLFFSLFAISAKETEIGVIQFYGGYENSFNPYTVNNSFKMGASLNYFIVIDFGAIFSYEIPATKDYNSTGYSDIELEGIIGLQYAFEYFSIYSGYKVNPYLFRKESQKKYPELGFMIGTDIKFFEDLPVLVKLQYSFSFCSKDERFGLDYFFTDKIFLGLAYSIW